MHIYLENISAKFHPDLIWNYRALVFFKAHRSNNKKNKNNNKMSSDMGSSAPDLKKPGHVYYLLCFIFFVWYKILACKFCEVKYICDYSMLMSLVTVSDSCLHDLLPQRRDLEILSRLQRHTVYPIPRTKTNKYRSFIHYALAKYQ